MRKILVVGALSLSIAGCAAINAAVVRTCNTEDKLHADYVAFVAPFRSADKVALEMTNYTSIKTVCLTGDPFGVLLSLTRAAASLRK